MLLVSLGVVGGVSLFELGWWAGCLCLGQGGGWSVLSGLLLVSLGFGGVVSLFGWVLCGVSLVVSWYWWCLWSFGLGSMCFLGILGFFLVFVFLYSFGLWSSCNSLVGFVLCDFGQFAWCFGCGS